MPKLTELTAANSLANSDLLVVTTNTGGTAVSNSVNVATLAQAVQVSLPIIKTITGDDGSVVASNTSAEVTIAGGIALNTNVSGNTITLNVDSSGLPNTFSTIVTDSGNVVSNSGSAFAVTQTGSNGVIISASGNTVTFSFDPSTINSLTDLYSPIYQDEASLPTESSDFDGHFVVAGRSIYHGANSEFIRNISVDNSADELKSHVKFTVSANGAGAYNFSGGGAQGSDNEDIYVYKGFTYQFDANSVYGSHPFQLRESDGGSAYSNGVTTTDGRVYFTVPQNAANLVYQCTSHSGMVGNIIIVT
jgi:hypothetical protein